MVPTENSIADLNTDRAIIAGADFDSWNYRTGFDLAMPFLGYVRDDTSKKFNKNRRPYWLSASIIKLTDVQLTIILDVATKSEQNILLLNKCPKHVVKRSSIGMRCAHGTTNAYDYKSVFAQSQFCLVAKNERLFQLNLMEALASNCIPVIFADNVIFPFNEVTFF